MKKKILFVASEFASGMIPFAATAINALAKMIDLKYTVFVLIQVFILIGI